MLRGSGAARPGVCGREWLRTKLKGSRTGPDREELAASRRCPALLP